MHVCILISISHFDTCNLCVLVTQSCPTLCNPMDCSTLGSSVHGILQAIVLERVAIYFSRGSSRPKDRTCLLRCRQDSLLSEPPGKPIWNQEDYFLSLFSFFNDLVLHAFSKRLGEGNGTPLQYSCLENPMDGGAWQAPVHGVAKSWAQLSDFTFTFHFHALEKEMATQSSILAWRIPGTEEPGGLPSMGSHRVGHDGSDLAAAAAATCLCLTLS